jgi:hypothetical protein
MTPRFDEPYPKLNAVTRDQEIYRIVDFFSAAQAVEGAGLYLPLASTFADANEAIDSAMAVLAVAAGPCAGITKHFGSQEEFIKYQRSVASRNYVSCWTKAKESVAMWALYSRDMCSVQLSTKVECLERAAISYADGNSDPTSAIAAASGDGQIIDGSKIVSVNYENWESIARSIDRRRRAYDKLEATGRIPKNPDHFSRGPRQSKREIQYLFEALKHKDQSFSHEAEVRLIMNFTPFNSDTLRIANSDMAEMRSRPDTNTSHPNHNRAMLLYGRAILREEAWKRSLSCTPHISLPLPTGFILGVTIDPRCPSHKQRFMKDYFQAHGIPVSDSSSFGHVAQRIVVSARRHLLADPKAI